MLNSTSSLNGPLVPESINTSFTHALNLLLILALPCCCQAREPLRLLIMDHVINYAPYIVRLETETAVALNGPIVQGFRGELVDTFSCIAELADFELSIDAVPLKRGLHSIRSGVADLLLPSLYLPQLENLLGADLIYSEELHWGYWSLVARADRRQLLQLPLADHVRVAVVRGSLLNGLLDNVVGHGYEMDVVGVGELFKALLSSRIDVVSVATPWPGEQLERFDGHALVGHTLRPLSYRALLSRQLVETRPQLLPRLNAAIAQCRHHFKVLAVNPFRDNN